MTTSLDSGRIVDVLARARDLITEQAEKIASLQGDNTRLQHEKRAEALLDTMEARGLAGRVEGSTRQEKIASLSSRNLDVVEQALDLNTTTGGMFDTTDRPAPGSSSAAEGRLLAELLTTN